MRDQQGQWGRCPLRADPEKQRVVLAMRPAHRDGGHGQPGGGVGWQKEVPQEHGHPAVPGTSPEGPAARPPRHDCQNPSRSGSHQVCGGRGPLPQARAPPLPLHTGDTCQPSILLFPNVGMNQEKPAVAGQAQSPRAPAATWNLTRVSV